MATNLGFEPANNNSKVLAPKCKLLKSILLPPNMKIGKFESFQREEL